MVDLITSNVRKVKKPANLCIFLPTHGSKRGQAYLSAMDENCQVSLHRISLKVAEILIANGMSYGD